MQCGGLLVDLFWLQQANIVQEEEEEEFPKYPLLYNTSYNPTQQQGNGRRGSSQDSFSLEQCYNTLGGGGGGGERERRREGPPLAYTNVIIITLGGGERKEGPL